MRFSRLKQTARKSMGKRLAGTYPMAMRSKRLRTNETARLKKRHYEHEDSTGQCFLLLILFALTAASLLFLIKLISLMPEWPKPSSSLDLLSSMPGKNLSTLLMSMDNNNNYQAEHRPSRWIVASPKCHIPVLDAWHMSINEYVGRNEPMSCAKYIDEYQEATKSKPDLEHDDLFYKSKRTISYIKGTRLFLIKSALRLGLKKDCCCYRPIERGQENDDDLIYQDDCVPVRQQGVELEGNFSLIQLECSCLNYTNVHSIVRHNDEEENALMGVAKEKLDEDLYFNVLMLGVDTISRLNGIRQLSLTLDLLRKQYETLEFTGYNKVGENTFPNLIPLLTGLKPEQLTRQVQCWQATNYTEANDKGNDYLDNCKYLWNFYQQLGYVTYFSEDWPKASTFNYLKPGFKHEPTTHYGRPFTIARDRFTFPRFKSIGCASCLLDTPLVQVDLDNLKSFITNYSNRPYFAFHWINCPQHDDLNGASRVDHLLRDFFSDIQSITKLDRTFVIFFSDHGYRWNNFVSTRIGHYESSLPMLTIAAPIRFIRKHPQLYKHLQEHLSTLITPFDLFKTLLDLRNLGAKKSYTSTLSHQPDLPTTASPQLKAQPVSDNNETTSAYPTAATSIRQLKIEDGSTFEQQFKILSLFDKHTPEELDRSCIESGIPDNYCVCHQFESTNIDTLDVLGAAYYLVYVHMNMQIMDYQKLCSLLDLEKIHKAELFDFGQMKAIDRDSDSTKNRRSTKTTSSSSNSITTTPKPDETKVKQDELEVEKKHKFMPNREYNIMVSTLPGGGLFQEVVRFYGDDMEKCKLAVEKVKTIVNDKWANIDEKYSMVKQMNDVCEFSVHSDSISRLNLYRDQSKCVKNNIELKKICYCK